MNKAEEKFCSERVYQISDGIDFDTKNTDVNQRLNLFLHKKIKQLVGIRAYISCLREVVFMEIERRTLGIICSTNDTAETIYVKYHSQISKFVNDIWHKEILIKYCQVVDGKIKEINLESKFIEKPKSQVVYFNEAYNKYTFENFVSSEENTSALEVCMSISCFSKKELVSCGSIVCIYGSISTGKTHLVNAIGNFYRENGGSAININANSFLRQYVDAVQKQDVFSFQENILKNDIIIIDDVDDLIGKNGTLVELKRILSSAIEAKKYIVLTTSISPKSISDKSVFLNEILSNATSWKLKEPKEALKTQIIMNYICEKNLNVPISIVRDLVLSLNCNVRELKNYIKKLAIVQSIRKFELNTSLALEILADDVILKDGSKHVSNDEILSVVANYYNITIQDLKSKMKRSNICRARNIAMHLMQKINSSNFQEIGRMLNRNHSTVISSIRNVKMLIENDKKMPAELADLMAKINGKNCNL